MPKVTITHSDGTTDTIPYTVGWERQQEVGKMKRLLIDVNREEFDISTLEPKSDKVELSGVDTTRLVDVQKGGTTVTLVTYSTEWDANRAGFTDGGNLRTGSDADLVNGLIGEVGGWTAGTVTQQATGLSFVFNHANRAEAIRRIEKNVPGEIQFRNLGTVDYVSRLGSDRSGSVELSSAAGTIEQSIQITERGRELDGTHIRVLGAHEGEAQLYANLVPSSDSGTYANRVNYTTSRWSDGDAKDWDRWVNKDVTDQATIEEEAANLGVELKETLVEAETIVPESVGLTIGDTVQVVKADANLDRAMRVHRLTRQAGGRNDAGDAAVVDSVLLSTRTILRTDDDDDLRDLQRFNSGFQGASVIIQGGGGRQPVTTSINATESFRYPPVSYENEAVVELAGLPYRAYSAGSTNNSDYSNIEQANSTVATRLLDGYDGGTDDHYVPVTDNNGNPIEFTVTSPSSYVHFFAATDVGGNNTSITDQAFPTVQYTIRNVTTGETFPVPNANDEFNYGLGMGFPDYDTGFNQRRLFYAWAPIDANGDTLRMEFRLDPALHSGSDQASISVEQYMFVDGKHTHDPDPGVIDNFPNHPQANASGELLPSNVDILVNGNTVATNVASGAFETTVDVGGQFTDDSWNTIEATSDSIGHIRLTPYLEAYKKVGGQ